MPEITIRRARNEDRSTVLAFCQNTWDWGDYIEQVWDEWLHQAEGVLLVALSDEQPVGLIHMRMLNANEAWLEGMRVDPAYRRQGLARQLNQEAIAEAMQRGATTTRLLIDVTNTASISLSEQMLFQRVGMGAVCSAGPLTSIPRHNLSHDQLSLATHADLDEIIDYLDLSNIFPATGGLYYSGFTGYRISDTLLREKIQNEQIYLLRRWERLDGLAIVERRSGHQNKPHLLLGYIDGTSESISLIAYELRRKLPEMQLEHIRAHVPDLMMVRDAFTAAEYTWNGYVFYTYERSLI